MTGEQRSQLHELKQHWKAQRKRWLTLIRRVDFDAERDVAAADAAWFAYEIARDVYFKAKAEYADKVPTYAQVRAGVTRL